MMQSYCCTLWVRHFDVEVVSGTDWSSRLFACHCSISRWADLQFPRYGRIWLRYLVLIALDDEQHFSNICGKAKRYSAVPPQDVAQW